MFQPELYKKELVRQASTESAGGQEMEYCGKLHFSLKYDKELEGLVVKVICYIFLLYAIPFRKKKSFPQ